MNILRANLKHLYQKRSFWLVGVIFGAIAFGIIKIIEETVTENKQGGFSAPVLWMFYISVFITSSSIDVLTKPFSYCLPGHRKIPRKFLFSIGLVLSFLWSLIFIFYPYLNIDQIILLCVSAFSVFTISYWLGAWFMSMCKLGSVAFGLLPLIMLANGLLNLSTIIEHAIVASPLLMILLGISVNFLAWRYWGRCDLTRRCCGELWMGVFDAWNRKKIAKYGLVKLAKRDKKKPNSIRVSSNVESFFISRIIGAGTGSLAQYIWGGLYKSFGIMFSQQRQDWMRFSILMLPILCLLCYIPGGGKNIIFVMPGIMVVHMSLGVYSSLMVSGGRRQRFWSALTLAAVTGIFVTVVVVVLAMATQLLEKVMPELTIRGHEFVFNALNMKFSPVPFAMIPVTLTIVLIFHKKPMLTMLLAIVLFQIFFATSILGELTVMNVPVRIGPVHIVIILLCSWTVFVGVLRYVSMRCCLVSQSR